MRENKKKNTEKLPKYSEKNSKWDFPEKDIYVNEPSKRKLPGWLIPSVLVVVISIFLIWFVPQLIRGYQLNKKEATAPILTEDPFLKKSNALVNQKTVRLYDQPRLTANCLSSCLFNEPVYVLDQYPENNFYKIELREGIQGYVIKDSLTFDLSSLTSESIINKVMIINGEKPIASDTINGDILAVAPMGSVVCADYVTDQVVRVILPGEKSGWINRENVLVLKTNEKVPHAESKQADIFCSSALKFLNVAYIPGGLSLDGIDLPGILYLAGQTNGIDIPRDINEQAKLGTQISFELDSKGVPNISRLKAGDLLFFSQSDESQLTSVGLYLSDDNILYAYGNQSSIDIISFQNNEKLAQDLITVRNIFN